MEKELWRRDEDFQRGITVEGAHKGIDPGTRTNRRGKTMTSGFHHLALVCRDMDETIKFYEEALGMKLRAIFPMHGVPGAKHCFLEAGNGAEISFVEFAEPQEGTPGVSRPEWNNSESPIGTQHHLSFKTDSLEHLYKLREQIKGAGTKCSKVLDHGFIHSFYFDDPNGFHLECSANIRGYMSPEYDVTLLDRKVDMSKVEWDESKQIETARAHAAKVVNKAKL